MKNQPLKGSLEKVTWKQVRADVAKVNPVFAKIIDEISPGDQYWLARVTYPYGSLVMERAVLHLPNDRGDIVPITDPSLDGYLREGFGYNLNSNPVSLVLKNSFEICLPLEDRTIPLSGLIYPGSAFGAWRILNPTSQHPAFIWSMTAGARSVFMLPKITEAKRHMYLRKAYGVTVDVPKSLMMHWEIFRQLAQSPNFRDPWQAEILYFPIQWFNHLDDNEWKTFYNYFRDSGWGASELWRNQFMWNLVFSLILKDYEGRPSAYIMDTVKYLLNMGISAFPGLAPARNELGGPFKEVQRVYTGDYGLKDYPPIIIQPSMFNMHDPEEHSVYYSLQFPTAPEFKPSSRVRASIISDLHEIRSLLMRCNWEILSDRFNLGSTALGDMFNHVKYDYFHSGVSLHAGMRNSVEIAREDKWFLTTLDGKQHAEFPDASSFVKGCIRLSHKKKT